MLIFRCFKVLGDSFSDQYLRLDLVVSKAEVLQIGSGVGLDRWKLVLQHLDHLWQLWIPPAKLPAEEHRQVGDYSVLMEAEM